MPFSDHWSDAALARAFGPRELEKARSYVGAVAKLEVRAERISAQVQGSARQPYRVTVTLTRGRDRYGDERPQGICSCPVYAGCKHAVAVLLAARAIAASGANPEILSWLEAFRQRKGRAGAPPAATKRPTQYLLYGLGEEAHGGGPVFRMFKARLNKAGALAAAEPWDNVERAMIQPPSFVGEADLAVFRHLLPLREHTGYWGAACYRAKGVRGAEALRAMLATGRLCLGEPQGEARLVEGPARRGRIAWRAPGDEVRLSPTIETDPPAGLVLPTDPFWYVDAQAGCAGPVDIAHQHADVLALFELPPLAAEDLPLVAAGLAELAPELPPPPADALAPLRTIDCAPVPVLVLSALPVTRLVASHRPQYVPDAMDIATVSFDYEDVRIEAADSREFLRTDAGMLLRIARRGGEESARLKELLLHGLRPLSRRQTGSEEPTLFGPALPQDWPLFVADSLPRLRAGGWRIEVRPEFRHVMVEPEAWLAELGETEDENGYALELGIVVEGKRISLEPLLAELFARDARWLSAAGLAGIGDEEAVQLRGPDGRSLRVRAQRLKVLVGNLIDLLDALPKGEPLRLSKLDAARLDALATDAWQVSGAAQARGLARRLAEGFGAIAPPPGLRATLREYQLQGMAWLQTLRAEGLGGVLADDMGLGKTVQALAHLLAEKAAGRLEHPALVVAPTSLMHNWREEARRFAPDLAVLTLQGPQRAQDFARVPQHDLVLTTYPLLWRDADELIRHRYSVVILDEAQMVKNAATQAAATVRRLDAAQRLALTGTPLENHLGELWSLFDFLLPGFLGKRERFARAFRTPIEKLGDEARRSLLAQRVRPFLLRRTKQQVARELPAKTVMVRDVALEGGQRDLYETVRAAMQARVTSVLGAKGLARSRIEVLDALLKLRQVCCDPRLLKLPQAEKVKESAKLQVLAQMLAELIEEGRRVLVFSAFAEMLALIAGELAKLGLAHVSLTGRTRDRAAVIERFQSGEVPVFLISLKAGGTGLNLTAADTVIHYDPWWNPAAEDQATDRAHRIGQTKPVFVYKLVAAGSIEEKIVALQSRKAQLARGILGEAEGGRLDLSEADLAALLAPLPRD
jgi:superfamily II DNA or RNA helicase